MSFWKPGETKKSDFLEDTITSKSSPKPTLSKNVMSMRFMKKREEDSEIAAQEELKRQKLLNPESVVSASNLSNGHGIKTANLTHHKILVCTREMTNLYSALPGRRSFGGFNKPIERNYDMILNKHKADKRYGRLGQEENDNGDADDEEMLKHFKNLRGKKRKAPPK